MFPGTSWMFCFGVTPPDQLGRAAVGRAEGKAFVLVQRRLTSGLVAAAVEG